MTRMLSEHMRTMLLVLLLCVGLLFWTLHVWQVPAVQNHGYAPTSQHSIHHLMICPPPPYDC